MLWSCRGVPWVFRACDQRPVSSRREIGQARVNNYAKKKRKNKQTDRRKNVTKKIDEYLYYNSAGFIAPVRVITPRQGRFRFVFIFYLFAFVLPSVSRVYRKSKSHPYRCFLFLYHRFIARIRIHPRRHGCLLSRSNRSKLFIIYHSIAQRRS